MTEQPLRITYRLQCAKGDDPAARARDIAVEQTVELPEGCFSEPIEERIVGEVVKLEPVAGSVWETVISYDAVAVGGEIPQLLNLLFGNISLKSGIRITRVEWPPSVLDRFGGPPHGIDGLRRLCGIAERRPLLCSALKPIGLAAEQLAEICFRLASSGIDIIKDDHGLADQESAPFRRRVELCQAAVGRANELTGGKGLYFPNLTGRVSEMEERLDLVRSVGCRGILISPFLVGPDTVRRIAESCDLAVLAHPSLAGAFFQPGHGIAPEVLLGQIFRILGSDGVIYPNVGGRFSLDAETCAKINENLRAPLGAMRPAFPVPAGGIDSRRVPEWIERYGVDIILLIGGSLYAQPDLAEAGRRLVESVRRSCRGTSVQLSEV